MNKLDIKKLNIDWIEAQRLHDEGETLRNLKKILGISRATLNLARKSKLFTKRDRPTKMSKDAKRQMSESRKKWLKENPDKHPWKRHNKFKSVPCDKFKEKLKSSGFNFIPEYQALEDRFFSIDVAFPDKKIGIEINGQQHYKSDGTLKDYYQDRHDLLVSDGWDIIEIHYSVVYNEVFVDQIIDNLTKNDLQNIDYSWFVEEQKTKRKIKREAKRKENEVKCLKCEKILSTNKSKTGLCRACLTFENRTVERPSKEVLEKEIEEMSWLSLGKKYGVSDNAVRKWARKYKIL
jgi:very-short-patch-repair endonuclease